MRDFPGIILVATIWAYWFGVAMMIARVRRETQTLAGLVPEERQERLMWLIWVPLVVAWIVIPYLPLEHTRGHWALPLFARSNAAYGTLRWVAALCALLSLLLTSVCWSRMGRHWRMDVSIARKGELITDGPFRYVRHPIYVLSRSLMGCSVVVVPTWPMLALAVVHLGLTELKARHEEQHLSSVHGAAYRDYVARTGRFLPRLRPAQHRSSATIRRP
jgi:protein-S-isoprenylcysteine O-methyltransferase Ste14